MSAPIETSQRWDARDKLLIGALALVLSPVLFALGQSWWNSDAQKEVRSVIEKATANRTFFVEGLPQ